MASLGELRYYVLVKLYSFANDDLGTARRVVSKQFYTFVSITESLRSETNYGGEMQNNSGITFEMIKTTDTLKSGDEIVYNNIVYRIDSIRFVHPNRIQANGKADTIG